MEKGKRIKASLTVEATFALPIFLFAVLAILYFMQILFIQDMLQEAMTRAARESSQYAYVYDVVVNQSGDPDETGSAEKEGAVNEESTGLVEELISDAYYRVITAKYVDKDFLEASCIVGGYEGISFFGSSFLEEEDRISLKASYVVKIPVPEFLSRGMAFRQCVESRGFVGSSQINGKEDQKNEKDEEKEDTVYVTPTGSCYHSRQDCSSIRLKIESVAFSSVGDRRNNGGGKYYPCEKCGSRSHGNNVYITAEGNRYHTSMSCSGIKRNVSGIKKSEAVAQGKRCCKRCGG